MSHEVSFQYPALSDLTQLRRKKQFGATKNRGSISWKIAPDFLIDKPIVYEWISKIYDIKGINMPYVKQWMRHAEQDTWIRL